MSLPFFYHAAAVTTNRFSLDEASAKHVTQVLRMTEGMQLHLTDGKGTLFTAEIVNAHKRHTEVSILSSAFLPRTGRKVSIGISLLKNKARFEWFLEKATELGVHAIYPMRCERSEKEQVRNERLQQIIVSAMLQSKQCWLPELHTPATFYETLAAARAQQNFLAHCAEDKEKHALSSLRIADEVTILIGPEGDFSPNEISASVEAGYEQVALGDNRLRTETAGVVAATLLCLP